MRPPAWLTRHLAALRALLVFTVLLGLAYPLALVGLARLPGLDVPAEGSLLRRDDQTLGSRLIGQPFTDEHGDPLPEYFQSRPSVAGAGYDPTATSASNLGPEDVVDTVTRDSLLTAVCRRSLAVGRAEGVDGSRPYCTDEGVGAVLGVWRAHGLSGPVVRVVSLNEHDGAPFVTTYDGVPVELAEEGVTYPDAIVTPIRGDAPSRPAVPADAVTASGSGLDPHISPEYAALQVARVARARGVDPARIATVVDEQTGGRLLGFLGEPHVNVLELNLALDERFPVRG